MTAKTPRAPSDSAPAPRRPWPLGGQTPWLRLMRRAVLGLVGIAKRHGARLGWAALAGVCGAAAFPVVIAAISRQPLLDAGPREILILVPAGVLYRFAALPSWRRAAVYG